jgi:hypothetical protein
MLRFLLCFMIAALIRMIVPTLLVGSLTSMISYADDDNAHHEPTKTLETLDVPTLCSKCDDTGTSSTTEKHRRLNPVTPPMIPQVKYENRFVCANRM